jgi:hypothetical protein
MNWIIKHKDGYEFSAVFKSYSDAELWLNSEILKGYEGSRLNYLIQTID